VVFALGSLPLYRLARRRLHKTWAARFLVACYLFYPVAQTAVLFDFHGDTLAAPLILFAVEAWDRNDKPLYFLWLMLALSCKFYVAVPVMGLGVVQVFKDDKRIGIWTIVTGLVWGFLTFFVIRSWAATNLTSSSALGATSEGYLSHYYGTLREVFRSYYFLPRLVTLVFVIAPALWLGRRDLFWWVPALTIILPALATSGQVFSYDYRFHHYAIAVPFLMIAGVYGAEKIPAPRVVPETAMQFAITLIFSVVLIDMPLNPMFWSGLPGWGLDAWAYGRTSRDVLKDRWLAKTVPADVPLGASFFLAPHVINRSRVVALSYPESEQAMESLEAKLETVDWVVADALFDYDVPNGEWNAQQSGLPFIDYSPIGIGHPAPVTGGVLYDAEAIRLLLQHPNYDLAIARDGLLLFGKRSLLEAFPLSVHIETYRSLNREEPPVTFGDSIGLVDARVEQVEEREFMLSYDWTPLESLSSVSRYIAVTTLEEVPNTRFVHLPTQVLYPTTQWEVDEVIHERFDVRIPDTVKPGIYRLNVSWYDSDHLYAAWTDSRSRLGPTVLVGTVTIEN
jgi:hypothetical protein